MKKWISLALLMGIIFTTSCSTNPITGRKQLTLVPESTVSQLSLDQYKQVLSESKVERGTADAQMINTVGQNIATAVEQWMIQNKYSDRIKEFNWEFNLIDENVVNAWCMPGGKVAFYTGILPYTQNDKGVAVVMGHEVAHAVARHGNERISQGLIQTLGGVGLQIALRDKPAQTQNLFMGAYGLGSQVAVMLPFSRSHETEADQMGVIFMAMAGYDPYEAPKFWERMQTSGGGGVPEFLSTHPSHETRIKNLNEKFVPQALAYYKGTPNPNPSTTTNNKKAVNVKPTQGSTNKQPTSKTPVKTRTKTGN
ncbi:MAG: M48 family metallopeptidase [Chitinophagales bacterium]